MVARLPRTVRLGSRGQDVDGHGEALHIYLDDGQTDAYLDQPDLMRRTFGIGKRTLAKKAAKKAGLPQYGIVGPALFDAISEAGAYKGSPAKKVAAYAKSLEPKVVAVPNLHPSLWGVFALGMKWGFSNLGTYNPASRLPSGKPSDHAVYPAFAIDFGIDPDTGWNNLKARAFVLLVAKRPEVEYVILGDRIYFGLVHRGYYGGGHLNHIHVSGRR